MYIPPNTTIRILAGVPLDNTYEHTIYFSSKQAQASYFQGKTKYVLDAQSYQRVQRGLMRVGIQAENLYDCNYVMFQNSAFGSRWFYAFIKGVEYINDGVSQVEFELDVMQTWFFDYTLKECFVEREHSATDVIGENTIPENLEIGPYMFEDVGELGKFNNYKIVIAATVNEDLEDATGGMYGGLYSGLYYNVFSYESDANQFLENLTNDNKADAVVSIFMVPAAFAYNINELSPTTYNVVKNKNLGWAYPGGPRNKKLYTYPFNLLYVTDLEGNGANYRFELFDSEDCEFNVDGVMSCSPEVQIYPVNYAGVQNNYNERLVISSFPQCAYAIDAFKAWIAQNKAKLIVDAANVLVTGALSAYKIKNTPAMGSGPDMRATDNMVDTFDRAANIIGQVYTASTMPPQGKGNSSNGLGIATGTKGFHAYYAHIRPEYAKILDDYFDRFGYATHRTKVPNRNVRPHWTYCKTVACTISGSVPADDANAICKIYNNGITWWKNGSEVGNYSLDNTV